MRKGKILFFLLAAVFGPSRILGQALPLGQWQSHFNYLSARQVVDGGSRVYCASYNGLFSVNTETGETRTFSKADGLSHTGISTMGYLPETRLLMLAYRNGTIDFAYLNEQAEPDQIETWDLLNETQGLPADKSIRRVVFKENLAYLATSFGVLVLDPRLRQVEETYRYIGPNGTQLAVSDLAFSGDSLYLITSQGMLATSMRGDVNRQYFGNWKPVNSPGSVSGIALFAGAIHAAVPGKGILRYEKGVWKQVYASNAPGVRILDTGEILTISTQNTVVTLDALYAAQTFNSPLFGNIQSGVRKKSKALWIADQKNGLITNQFSEFKQVSPAQADTAISPRSDSTITDLNGLSWTRLPETLGGGIMVSNADGSRKKVLSTSLGTGSLPASKVNSLALDQDGFVWFAGAKGV